MKYSLPLAILGLALGYAAFEYGAVLALPLFAAVLTIALTALVWMRRSRVGIEWPVLVLPFYAFLQFVPLPLWVLSVLSPVRAR
ncbi:MAG: hypothetical protein ABSG25_04040, partial [Bryobacteraceae bacterium]